jgi:mono/diheme cytochrome c family protein
MQSLSWTGRAAGIFVSAAMLSACAEVPAEFDPEELEPHAAVDASANPLAFMVQPDAGGPALIDATMQNAHSDASTSAGALYTRVYALMAEHCVNCHGAGKTLDLSTPELAHAQLVGVAAQYKACASDAGAAKVRVIAGAANESLLVEKLEGRQTCGKPMPTTGMLSTEEIAVFRDWISAGAKLR